jgi:TRAP-type C4-dicarboxylate transport system permease small subunit
MMSLLQRASEVLAVLGALVLLAVATVAGVSILGRWLFDTPITGDVELMQVACVVAIACFLPYCQWRGGHVRVEFFTQRIGPRQRGALDRLGQALLAAIMLLLAWRAGVGVAEMKANGETTMVLGFPAWLMYLALVPGLLLSAVVGLHAAVTGTHAERSEGAF